MQIRLYVDYVSELLVSPSGNKWILIAVCPFSNYLRAIPVPGKTATTAANALLMHYYDISLLFGFLSVLRSDHGGEWLDALLHHITQLLSIRHVFTSGFRPRLNGATERTHSFLMHPWVYIVNISKSYQCDTWLKSFWKFQKGLKYFLTGYNRPFCSYAPNARNSLVFI